MDQIGGAAKTGARSIALAIVLPIVLIGCGRVADQAANAMSAPSPGASLAPSAAPTSTSELTASNCVSPGAGARTSPLGRDGVTLQIAPGWTPSAPTGESETLLLQLNAPASYGPHHVVFQLHSLLGPRHGSTSHREADADRARQANQSSPGAAIASGSTTDCNVGNEPASFVRLTRGGATEIRIYVLHHFDGQYPFLYLVVVTGTGGVDSSSMQDIKRMLGSWSWAQ
jgi:hypothetical protein